MKRDITFVLKSIHPDYKVKAPKELMNRIDKRFKLIGEIKAGNKLEMYFEDGEVYKTSPMDIQGYITKYDDDILEMVTLCTKDMSFEFGISNKDIKIKLVEQLGFA